MNFLNKMNNIKEENNSQPKVELQDFNKNNSIYIPSLEMYFAKEITHFKKNWFESNKLLQENNEFMPTIPHFIESLKYLKSSNNKEYLTIYKDITERKGSWRAEWLDADFKVKDKKLYVNYNHVLDSNGPKGISQRDDFIKPSSGVNLIPKNLEILDSNTLMKDKALGINLEDYINKYHTKQGLPTKKTKSGEMYYWYPRSDNNSVARFSTVENRASLVCNGNPSYRNSNLGVRACKMVR